MKEVVVISGKGGTGKTSIVSGFASLAKDAVLCDADVDAADLYLILKPKVLKEEEFKGGHEAKIDLEKCSECGLCLELCKFSAISEDFVIDPFECEGCGVCYHFCPEEAIEFKEKTCGKWFLSETRCGPFVHARLNIAEENSGKLVAHIRQKAKELCEEKNLKLIITDGPPGIGCPVIASIGGADLILVVVEPTVSGIHDMKRVIDLANHFKVPAMVCINKADLNQEMTKKIKEFLQEKKIKLIGEIPFSKEFVYAMINEKSIVEHNPKSPSAESIKKMWKEITNFLTP